VLRAIVLLFVTAAASSFASADPIDALRDAIAPRLALMEEVAQYKWNAGLPIADPDRESALLERATAAAVAIGLPEDYARRALAAQIEASRALQMALFDRWRATGQTPFDGVSDLASVQRPRIDAATTHLLEALESARCRLHSTDARAKLGDPPAAFATESTVWSIATAVLFTAPTC
jgi:cyclohexadienyl dehydratase